MACRARRTSAEIELGMEHLLADARLGDHRAPGIHHQRMAV